MTNFTWSQMLDLIVQVEPYAKVVMRKFGDFYVADTRLEQMIDGGFFKSIYGNGESPEKAVEDHFNLMRTSNNLIINEHGHRYLVFWDDKSETFRRHKQW